MNAQSAQRTNLGRAFWFIQLLVLIADFIICETVGLGRLQPVAMACEVMNLLCIAMLVLMSLSCLRAPAVQTSTLMFQSVLFLVTLNLFLDSLGWVTALYPGFRWLSILVSLLYHLGLISQTWLYWYFLCVWLEISQPLRSRLSRWVDFLGACSCLLILGNLRGEYFYIINSDNVYVRARFYPLSLLGPAFMLAFCFFVILRGKHSPAEKAVMLTYPLMPCLGFVISLNDTSTIYANILLFLSIFLFYNSLYIFQQHKLLEMRAELQEKHTQLMLSQIQPHFLYNALGAISHLCKKDAALAREAIDSFSAYLRMNLDSIDQKAMVPFARELKHVRAYLWLEQLRFGEDLQVTYDIPFTDFQLPTLTLQPLVENAVKHGICRTEYGGTVAISVQREENRLRLTVRDDGAGFDPAQPPAQDGRSHLGIENVRSRLDVLCGGQLLIESRPGEGTAATILLPMEVLQ